MKKDIEFPQVEGVSMAVVKEKNELQEEVWNAYLLNLKEQEIYGVLVTSKGYGAKEGERVKTSVLRHFLDKLEPKTSAKVEEVMTNLFGLNNEFWVSFYVNGKIYDKKYIFLPETISEENLIRIPILEKLGVMIA